MGKEALRLRDKGYMWQFYYLASVSTVCGESSHLLLVFSLQFDLFCLAKPSSKDLLVHVILLTFSYLVSTVRIFNLVLNLSQGLTQVGRKTRTILKISGLRSWNQLWTVDLQLLGKMRL